MNTAKSLLLFSAKFIVTLLIANFILDALDLVVPGGVSGWVYSPLKSLGFGKPKAS